MKHDTPRFLILPPRMYAANLHTSPTSIELEFAAGLDSATLALAGPTAELLADLDTLQAALEDARRRVEQAAAFAEYDVPAPRPASEVEFIIAAEWTQVAR